MSLLNDLKIEGCNSKGYLDSYKCNIYGNEMPQPFQEMFDSGSGSELHSKAEAVHSSSMLSYNIFHWIKENYHFKFNDADFSNVYFEVKMKTLKGRSNPANMDVVLDGEKNGKRILLFIESKFTEYTKKSAFELSDSYRDSKKWYDGAKNIKWNELINSSKIICGSKKGYGEGLKQEITHLFGITSLKDPDALKYFNSNNKLKIDDLDNIQIEFANVIFEPRADYQNEHSDYNNYKSAYTVFSRTAKEIGLLEPKWFTYRQIWDEMKTQIPKKNFGQKFIDYINNRYIKFWQ